MAASSRAAAALPTPFYGPLWPHTTRLPAQALWDWHLGLWDAYRSAEQGLGTSYQEEAQRIDASKPVSMLAPSVCRAAYRVCVEHDLDRTLLARQIAPLTHRPAAYQTAQDVAAFVDAWAAPHALLLGRLMGVKGQWQEPPVRALARAFFLLRALVCLPDDLRKGLCWIPHAEQQWAGVAVPQLRRGQLDERLRRLMWKQVVRVRDQFAQALPLVHDLPRAEARVFKVNWLGGLEVLAAIERSGYDVWTAPVRLSRYHRALIHVQARLGKATFKR